MVPIIKLGQQQLISLISTFHTKMGGGEHMLMLTMIHNGMSKKMMSPRGELVPGVRSTDGAASSEAL